MGRTDVVYYEEIRTFGFIGDYVDFDVHVLFLSLNCLDFSQVNMGVKDFFVKQKSSTYWKPINELAGLVVIGEKLLLI